MEMHLIDDFLEIEEKKEGWKVSDDLKADWCLDKIREIKAEYTRLEIVALAKIEQIQSVLDKKKEQMQNETGYFESKLRDYFETVKAKETKTQKKYTLPSGCLKLTKAKTSFDYDKSKLLIEAKANEMTELVKIKEEFDWANLKKNIVIVDNNIINKETGEVVNLDGLRIVEKPAVFKVEL